MYKTVLLPQILYASVVWWLMVSRVEVRNLLQSLQGSYPKVAVGSMKTTPTEVLEVALCLNPLNLAVTGAARFTAYGLNRQGEWRNTGLGHRKLELFQKHPLKLTKDRILKKYQLVIQYKVLIPIREDWCMLGKITNPNVIWYTDRSGIKNRFGAGIYGPRDNHKENIPVG
jgi:hypothetical protein